MKAQAYVEAIHQGKRLDKVLSEVSGLSRSHIQDLIKRECVWVNQGPCKSNTVLKEGDLLVWEIKEAQPLDVQKEAIPLDIRYEDEDVLVINKPKGMVVHPANGHTSGTLVNALLHHCQDLSGINGILRPGIVHRIDKDTSGLLVVAKNDMAHQALVEQLKDKRVNRRYYALVHGVLPHEYGVIDAPIARDPKDRQKMCVSDHNGKDARTHFKVVQRFSQFTLVECRLETGRTHQIRVHMQYIGYPIAGDPKYSYRRPYIDSGQLLHAYQLSFIHPRTQQEISVEAELPKEFQQILAQLANH
ncbi:MAG: RluA family pseudouridine synthase [Erysipelotrichaceae bacterium]|nr:RluA family pseudouridine synthase [Erysipelotrichaceae bacterium]